MYACISHPSLILPSQVGKLLSFTTQTKTAAAETYGEIMHTVRVRMHVFLLLWEDDASPSLMRVRI